DQPLHLPNNQNPYGIKSARTGDKTPNTSGNAGTAVIRDLRLVRDGPAKVLGDLWVEVVISVKGVPWVGDGGVSLSIVSSSDDKMVRHLVMMVCGLMMDPRMDQTLSRMQVSN
nr:hypothetical protein [Tanacetum cinerariifolium]